MERYRSIIIKSVTWTCGVGSVYFLYQIVAVDVSTTPEPFWELFVDSEADNARAALTYILVGIFLGLFALLMVALAAKFAYNMVHGTLSKIVPHDWRSLILPVVLLATLFTLQGWKGPIKHAAISAYLQVDEIIAVAGGYDPGVTGEVPETPDNP